MSNFVWSLSEAECVSHNHNVCPKSHVGRLVHSHKGKLVTNGGHHRISFIPASGLFEGKELNDMFQMDDSRQCLQLAVAFAGGATTTSFNEEVGGVHEVWQRIESYWGT